MAIEVIENKIEGAGYRFSYTLNEYRRNFYVRGLTPGPAIFFQAATAVDAVDPTKRIPAFAELLPGITSGIPLVADDFHIRPYLNARDAVLIDTLYHPITLSPTYQPIVTFNGTTIPELTTYDADGNVIKVFYIPKDGSGTQIVVGQVTRRKSLGILTIERVEYEDPRPIIFQYLDKMNADTFWGAPKWFWVVRDIVVTKVWYTSGFLVRYTLEYDPKTHIKTAIYRDPISGDIPSDVDSNPDPTDLAVNTKGYRNAKMNTEINFSGLSLPGGFLG